MTRPAAIRRRTWELLEAGRSDDRASRVVDWVILTVIVINAVLVVLETVPRLVAVYAYWFYLAEVVSVIIFTVEYVARVWSAVADPRFRRAVVGRLMFMRTPLAVIDLLAVLPFYLPLIGVDLRILRLLRLGRLFRLAKLFRYVAALSLFHRVLRRKKEQLLVTAGMVGGLILIGSVLMYYAERAVQPDAFESIPASMWWSVVTLTTVGYGDVYPLTTAGRMLAGLLALFGVAMVALPAAIFTSGLVAELEERTRQRESRTIVCPHCGEEINVDSRTGAD